MRVFSMISIVVSVALAVSLVGCGDNAENKDTEKKDAGKDAGAHHDHPNEGPHHGVLVELGNEEYHAEVCHDDAANKVTVYILDSKVKNAVPVAEKDVKINVVAKGQPAQFVLPAAPLEGETDGKSSRFELVDVKLCEALDAEGAKVRLKLNIGGAPYEGDVAAHDHDHDKE